MNECEKKEAAGSGILDRVVCADMKKKHHAIHKKNDGVEKLRNKETKQI